MLTSISKLIDLYHICGGDLNFSEKPVQWIMRLLKAWEKTTLEKAALPKNANQALLAKALALQNIRSSKGVWAAYHAFVKQIMQEKLAEQKLPGIDAWQSYIVYSMSDAYPLPWYKGKDLNFLKTRIRFFGELLRFQLPTTLPQLLAELYDPELLETMGISSHSLFLSSTQQNPWQKNTHESLQLEELAQLAISQPEQTWAKLQSFWQSYSGGVFSKYSAFHAQLMEPKNRSNLLKIRWVGKPLGNQKTFSQLIGFENNQQSLIANTQAFLQGLPFSHVVLWGDRGMGKTSSVVALVNYFSAQSLKLVEVDRTTIHQLPQLWAALAHYREKFILLLDDISFDAHNPMIGILKTLLEGALSFTDEGPKNIVCLVTSNHRDLVVLDQSLDETNPKERQILDEARALDDRFGLKLFYAVWQFGELKKNLLACARMAGITIPNEDECFRLFINYCRYNQQDQPSARAIQLFLQQQYGLDALGHAKIQLSDQCSE